ncbi:MAG TPA: hypothetical protein VHZ30_03105 [Verrucomicrobiae bacterium]|jgi:hypothetical protein|nr:hypothetical protein [Verrucomicrobiae bacterium]
MSLPNSFIRPEIAAQKMAALKNLKSPNFAAALGKEPRLTELHWFIQAESLQAGGLEKFTGDFLGLFSDAIGTEAMRRIAKTDEPYTARERNDVIDSFRQFSRNNLSGYSFPDAQSDVEVDHMLFEFENKTLGALDYGTGERSKPDPAFVSRQNFPYFLDYCKRIAAAALPRILMDFCTKPDAVIPEVGWFDDLPGSLVEMLDAHAGRAAQEIVMTEVASQVTDALHFAWQEKAMV